MQAYNPQTGNTYESWEALVAAESNGWMVCLILTDGRETWPYMAGPVALQKDARNLRARLRRKFKNAPPDNPNTRIITTSIRPAWKPTAS